jgi:hypothetical protein
VKRPLLSTRELCLLRRATSRDPKQFVRSVDARGSRLPSFGVDRDREFEIPRHPTLLLGGGTITRHIQYCIGHFLRKAHTWWLWSVQPKVGIVPPHDERRRGLAPRRVRTKFGKRTPGL